MAKPLQTLVCFGGHREPREGPGSGGVINDSGKNDELDVALFITFSRETSAQTLYLAVCLFFQCTQHAVEPQSSELFMVIVKALSLFPSFTV